MKTRVLVVDDAVEIHHLLGAILPAAEMEIVSAADPENGLRLAASLTPELILLDVDMPVMDGYEFCRRLKADASLCPIPVMFLTARMTQEQQVRGLALGAVDYLIKPFHRADVLARVRAVIASGRAIQIPADSTGVARMPRILVVDDSIEIQLLIKVTFSGDRVEVHHAASAALGLSAAAKLMPDLIILDLAMPGMDGYEFCRRVKADAALSAVPVLFLTAIHGDAQKARALESGAIDFITKPFTAQSLRPRILDILKSKQPAVEIEPGPAGRGKLHSLSA